MYGGGRVIQQITNDIFRYIMKGNEFNVHFQPIVSVGKGKLIGMESLLRASFDGEGITPGAIFSYARKEKRLYELDIFCHSHAMKQYTGERRDALLFVNVEASLLQDYLRNRDQILEKLDRLGIARKSIVIEISERIAEDEEYLSVISQECKKAGFLVAIDDVGTKNSNLCRILKVMPDIIKLDRSVINNIHKDYMKQEAVRGICEVCQRIGAIPIAEGTELEEEVVTCMLCGIDWFQGFYFDKAMSPELIRGQSYSNKCRNLAEEYRQRVNLIHKQNTVLIDRQKNVFHKLLRLAEQKNSRDEEGLLSEMVQSDPSIECIYILNEDGIQISDTVFRDSVDIRNQITFSSMKKGDYHITKQYYYLVVNKKKKIYVSQPYISQLTGKLCRTISTFCKGEYVLCVDFFQNSFKDREVID